MESKEGILLSRSHIELKIVVCYAGAKTKATCFVEFGCSFGDKRTLVSQLQGFPAELMTGV